MTKILERLFFRLTEVYPEFDGLPEDWLPSIDDLSVDEIKRGIEALDPAKYSPSPETFRKLCGAKAKDAIKAIEEPPERPPLAPKVAGGMQGSKAWAYRLKARYEAGEKLSTIQMNYWQSVCGRKVILL